MKTLSILVLSTVALLGSTAAADKCKKPNVVIKNDRSETIKVQKIQYYDVCDKKWRTEDLGDTEISKGGSRTFTDDLEYVGNCAISKFKVFRDVRSSTGAKYDGATWTGDLIAAQGSSQRCNTGVTFTLRVK